MLDSAGSSSLVPVAVPAAPVSVRVGSPVRGASAFRSVPLSLSLLAHVGLAFVAGHHYRSPGVAAGRDFGAVELAAPDLVIEAEAMHGLPEESAPPNRVSAPSAHPAAAASVHAAAAPPAAALAPAPSTVADAAESIASQPAPVAAPHFSMTVAVSSKPVAAFANTAAATLAPNASVANGAGANGVVDAPLSERAVDFPAKLVAGAPPAYTSAAQAAGIEADVPLEIVVNRAGAVESARALGHVGYGLDEVALSAVRGYRFSAARRAGSVVPVRMRWVMRFQLR